MPQNYVSLEGRDQIGMVYSQWPGEVNKSQWGEVGSKSALGEGDIKVLFGLSQ